MLEYTDMPNNSLPGRGARRNSIFAATFLTALLVAPIAYAAEPSDFGNPKHGSDHSGASMFAGWHCGADEVTLEVDGGIWLIDAATKTEFGTTEEFCGDTDNGWGVLWNFNQFGEGEHTVIAKADGVQFGSEHTFTVTKPTDENFNRDLVGTFTLPDFPEPGQAVDVTFQTGTQNFGMAPAGSTADAASFPAAATEAVSNPAVTTLFTFGNPANFAFVSGAIIFSGWVCDATLVKIVIDGITEIFPAYPTTRGDTEVPCGDFDNGFAALWNVNQFGNGAHTAALWIDGELATTHFFWVTKPSDDNFNREIDGEFRLPGFPDATKDTIIAWQTESQNWVIKAVVPTTGPTPTPGPGSVPTPGVTPTASPVPTQTPDGGATPTPTPGGGATPTPTPGGGPVCGNGIVESGEQCDGADLGENETCFEVYGGYHPEVEVDECLAGSTLTCGDDCQYDGTLCSCTCEEDFDCSLPESYTLDCTPTYCTTDFCDAEDVGDCECMIGYDGDIDGACVGSNLTTEQLGLCITNPFDPGENDSELIELCTGFDGADPDYPRCDYCDY